MRRAIVVVIAVLAFVLVPTPAFAVDHPVRIIDSSTVDPDPVTITVGETITWTNDDRLPHDIYLEGGKKLNSTPILPGDSFTTDPILTSGRLRYGLRSSDVSHTIISNPKPTTTTAPTTTTTSSTTTVPSTTAPPTTAAPAPTSALSTSTASSSTTSSTIAAAAPPPSGGGGSSAAPLLAAAAAVVAALAGVTFWAWRRSGEIPYGSGAGTSSAPPTAGQAPV